MTRPLGDLALPSAAQCVPVTVLALKVLADLRSWAAEHPQVLGATPIEALAISTAAISPWRGAGELRLSARMYVWAYALDDHVEQNVRSLDELDDLFGRCEAVVRGGGRDDSHPLLASLSGWQSELERAPHYPKLAGLWGDRFAEALRGERYDWTAGLARDRGEGPSDPQEYLTYAASSNAWITHFPRWATSDRDDLVENLPLLDSALETIEVAVRLSNDLATFERERAEPGQNNILMYDTSPAWVQDELDRRSREAREQLDPSATAGFAPAAELLRLLDWSVTFYSGADFRGWGSDRDLPGESGTPATTRS
ncbi:terpene synthase family protein [Streptomyces globisporus]|uniref:terpene synthase family protein n=1 Tax=Streptomyces globisporus TaxID=1908 RepID=UPI003674FBA2